ncbi:HdeD family acid-resistance protein [Paraoerskovia marina]|uniref:HdeD family acid-resistance protein n=1 Tax=Paraoerskovia marina TaxID=545619 RepID=UPI0004925E04|nr:DUF308 domain-containing protein [Paraoerskovia marina]
MSTESLSAHSFDVARRVWATALVRGVLFLVVGLVMYFWPSVGNSLVQWLLVALFALQAVILFIEAARMRPSDTDGSNWRYVLGGVAAAVALATAIWPESTFTIVLRLVAIWALVAGVIGVVSAARGARAGRPQWDMELTVGLMWSLFGIMVLVKPLDDIQTVTLALSVFLSFSGLLLTVSGFALARQSKSAPAAATAGGHEPIGDGSTLEQAPEHDA